MATDPQGQSVLDQAMAAENPQPTQQSAPTSGGSVLDQAMAAHDQANPPATDTTPTQSPYNMFERAEGAAMQYLPFGEDNKVLNWVNKHVVQPPVIMGREVGNIVSHQGLGFIGESLHPDTKVPKEIQDQGLETEWWAQKLHQENPILAGAADSVFHTVGELLGNPTNWPLMGGAAAKSAVAKAFGKAFGAEMGVEAINEAKDLWDNWGTMSPEQQSRAISDLITHTYFARQGVKGHGTAETREAAPAEKAAPKAEKPTRVVGEVPTTKTIGGVEIPVSAQKAESVAGPKNMPVEASKSEVADLKEHQRLETAPAATRAAHSVMGQAAEDMVNNHDSIVNGKPLAEKVSGSDTPSKYDTIDDASSALYQKAQSTTYAKADDISAREQEQWKQEAQRAIDADKAATQHYNDMVDEHNANLGEGEEDDRMEHIQHDPSKVELPERPKTYSELKGDLDRANAQLDDRNAQVREEARDASEKAEKALDQWFKQHSDEISPEEYQSAKKLIGASYRYQEIANSLRASMLNDDLTGNKLRGVIAKIDNDAINKRGETPGAFRRLVGDDVYQNWRDIARLFDPIKGVEGPKTFLGTLGKLALHYAAYHFLGPLGLVGSAATHWLMDRALSSPGWGDWFKDLAASVGDKMRSGKEIPQNLLDRFKSLYDNSKVSGEEGAAGADVARRNVGEPVRPKFGRVGLGGTPEETPTTPREQNAPDRLSVLDQAMQPESVGTPAEPAKLSMEPTESGFTEPKVTPEVPSKTTQGLPTGAEENPSTQQRPVGSTVQLMDNPLKVKGGAENKASTADVAMALNDYTKRSLKPLEMGEAPSQEQIDRAKSIMEDEAKYQMAQDNSGASWYTTQMDEHDQVLREMRPELNDPNKLSLFKFAEAILSSGQKPYRNFKATVQAWDIYHDTGKFPRNQPNGKSWGPRGVNSYGYAFDALNDLVKEKGEAGAVEWMLAEHPIKELRKYNDVAGKMTDMRPGVMVLGEKRGPFALNLHKIETAFTADMWVSRTWNRWMGTMELSDDPDSKDALASDSPRSNAERALMKQSFAEVADKLGLTTSSLQAVLWYYEQALYSVHGSPKESWSFSDAARRVQQEDAGQTVAKVSKVRGRKPDLTAQQPQMTHLGPEDHHIASDFETQVPDDVKAKWQGKPQPARVNTSKGMPRASYIDDLADHLNANFTHEDALHTAAHETAHALLQHELGIPTDDSSMELGNRAMVKGRQDRLGHKATSNGVTGGGWAPGQGWQTRFDDAVNSGNGKAVRSLLHDYVTQLMGGRAVEELLDTKSSDVDMHARNDENIARRVMAHYGVPSYLHPSLMQEATARAKAILHDKWDTVSHTAAQLAHHFGGDVIDSKTFHHYRQGGTYENKP